MADVHRATDAPSSSYKDKLLQASEHDELSHPDQAPKPKLPPTTDEGSPPMTVAVPETQAPAGAADMPSMPGPAEWQPAGSTQTAIDARYKFEPSGPRGKPAVKEDYVLKEGQTPTAQPQHDDEPQSAPKPEQQSASQSTEESTGGGDAGGQLSQESAQINIAEAGPSTIAGTTLTDVEQQVISDPSTADLLAAATQADDAVINPEPPKANVVVVQADETSDVKGMQGDISAVLPAGGSAAGTPMVTGAAAAAAGDTSRDESKLTEVATPAGDAKPLDDTHAGDAKPAGDTHAGDTKPAGDTHAGDTKPAGDTSRVNQDVDSSAAAPTDATPAKDDTSYTKPADDATAGITSDTAGDTKPAESGAAASYGHLQQTPAAVGDPAAVPAPATPDSSGLDEQQQEQEESSSNSGSAAQILQIDASAGGADVATHDTAGDTDTTSGGAGLHPLKAVGAAISKVADLVMGPDVAADLDLPGSDNQQDKQQAGEEGGSGVKSEKVVESHPVQ